MRILRKDMFMGQESLRTRLKNFIKVEGIRQKHIANQIDISESLLSRFKNELVELDDYDSEHLSDYLLYKGY